MIHHDLEVNTIEDCNMRITESILIFCCAIEIVYGLRCYQCQSTTEELCRKVRFPIKCMSNKQACQTISFTKEKHTSEGYIDKVSIYRKGCAPRSQRCDEFCLYSSDAENCKVVHCCTTDFCNERPTEREIISRRTRSGSSQRSHGGSPTLYPKWILLLLGIVFHWMC